MARFPKRVLHPIFALAVVVSAAASVFAERLPVTLYSAADGLGSGFVDFIYRDSRGFMWFCTRDGLSRFDGSRFVTYKLGDDTSPPGIENIFETRDGTYWVTTTGGTFRLDGNAALSRPEEPFTLKAEGITRSRGHLFQDRNGTLWMGAEKLYRLQNIEGKDVFAAHDLGLPSNADRTFLILGMVEAPDLSIWLNTSWGLVRWLPDGRRVFYPHDRGVGGGSSALLVDRSGRVWLSRSAQLIVFKPEPIESIRETAPVIMRAIGTPPPIEIKPESEVRLPRVAGESMELRNETALSRASAKFVFQTSDGDVWISGENTLLQFSGNFVHLHTDAEGLPSVMFRMAEDSAGNLWIGGHTGLARLDRNGLISFGGMDGFVSPRTFSINESADGRLFFGQRDFYWTSFDGSKFRSVRPQIDENATNLWSSRFAFLSRSGDLWMLTGEKLYRFSNGVDLEQLQGRSPDATYSTREGLKSDSFIQIFEDSAGDIWVSTRGNTSAGNGLARLHKGESDFRHFSETDGLPNGKTAAAFAEDKFGNIWVSFYEHGLARFDGQRLQYFDTQHGLPGTGLITDIHFDSRGRLWLATSVQGLFQVNDPTSPTPVFSKAEIKSGEISSNVRTLTEDRFGRLYLGTARGIDRYSPETGTVKHYSVMDGLADDFVVDSHCDRNGDLWFATNDGISRLRPLPDDKVAPPPILIGGLRISGTLQPVSTLGQTEYDAGELSYTDNNFQIDYLGLDFRASETLRYQYKLEGADEDWSAPTESRTVTFANLRPAAYRFMVRAVNSEGSVSETPASVAFVVLPPIWQRWWFLLGVAVLVAGSTLAVFRYRTNRLLEINRALADAREAEEKLRRSREERLAELEKVRSRIATDLHDDIGASLTQIAILSEVAQAQSGGNGAASDSLGKITDVSNELVGTMSDIVWSINPSKDHLSDLTQRMRRFASDILSSKGIAFHFETPSSESDVAVTTNIRREVFLIFKETINNIVKHAGAKNVSMRMEIHSDRLHLNVADDGVGIQREQELDPSGGNGLPSILRRAKELDGELSIDSPPGGGTVVNLIVPLYEVSATPATHTGGAKTDADP